MSPTLIYLLVNIVYPYIMLGILFAYIGTKIDNDFKRAVKHKKDPELFLCLFAWPLFLICFLAYYSFILFVNFPFVIEDNLNRLVKKFKKDTYQDGTRQD